MSNSNNNSDNKTEVRDNEIWLKPFLDFKERSLGTIEDTYEQKMEELKETFNKFESKVNSVFEKIDNTSNKGSFLVQLSNFKDQLSEIVGVGDFEGIHNKIDEYENQIKNLVQANRERNYEIKSALLEELRELVGNENWHKANAEIKELHGKWLKTGAVITEKSEELESTFQNYIDKFYEERKKLMGTPEELLEKYKSLVEKSKATIESGSGQVVKSLKEIQQEWKELGRIPKEQYAEVFGEFKSLYDDFFDKRKVSKEKERSQYLAKNLDSKKSLIEEVKELSTSFSGHYFNKIKELRVKWKGIGPVIKEESDQVWHDFNYQIERFIETQRMDKYGEKLKKEQGLNDEKIISEKIKHLKALIRKEKESLEKMSDNLGTFRLNHKSQEFSQVLDSKTNEQRRKLEVKQALLKELETQLKQR